jgi:hypothetical protein
VCGALKCTRFARANSRSSRSSARKTGLNYAHSFCDLFESGLGGKCIS